MVIYLKIKHHNVYEKKKIVSQTSAKSSKIFFSIIQ